MGASDVEAQISIPKMEAPEVETPEILKDDTDYSRLSEREEKELRIDKLFEKLAVEEESEQGALIAEEISALWSRSGSASVDLLLQRGTQALNVGDLKLARKMFNHVTYLEPNFAEGWARSGSLAFVEDDLERAVSDFTQTLIFEPRHIYALGGLGAILEKLGRVDQAYEVFSESYRLYPSEPTIKRKYEALSGAADGSVL